MGIPQDDSNNGATFLGHPRGLATLFFTEMWERFSYYGMARMLILFMTTALTSAPAGDSPGTAGSATAAATAGADASDGNAASEGGSDSGNADATENPAPAEGAGEPLDNPGMGLDRATASAIYGLYTSLVYFLSLAGGWVADNVWGQRKSVFVGGCIIAAGHFSMAIPTTPFFFLGLVLIIIGTGLLKPNVSTMVGDLYPKEGIESGARRDAGFSIFYMGINLGAFLGPMLCGFLGENYSWHLGFSLAGFGMIAGLIQYKLTEHYLGEAGQMDPKADPTVVARNARMMYGVSFVTLVLVAAGGYLAYLMEIDLTRIAGGFGTAVLIVVAMYFLYLWTFAGHTTDEKKRVAVIFWLFLLSAVFWAGFEQAGSSLNIFANEYTNRVIAGWEMPASWLQSVNSVFIIILAPIFGSVWMYLSRINTNPSMPAKFGLGLLGLAGGFFVLAWGAANASETNLVSPSWLVVTYFLHTVGELCLSPVGLSSVTKLAPENRVGQMMGIWFVGTAVGNLFAGLVSAQLEDLGPDQVFLAVAVVTGGAALLALIASPLINRLTGGKT